MIDASQFLELLIQKEMTYFTGVPDSLLKEFGNALDQNNNVKSHVISPNEGTAVAVAIGYNLATNKIPVVYMQNSGLGNALNPLISLAHQLVYKIPMLLIIGWRGSPGLEDEPQHLTQGMITREILELVGINYFVIDSQTEIDRVDHFLSQSVRGNSPPCAILISPGVFRETKTYKVAEYTSDLSREEALQGILASISERAIVVATTGKLSRELNELRETTDLAGRDFLTVGGMGHASAIALGIARETPERLVICLDGDGALQMHLGASALIGECAPKNFVHVLINNGIHESVGGQKIAASKINYANLAIAFGYRNYQLVESFMEIQETFYQCHGFDGPCFIEVRVNSKSRKNLSRPKANPLQNKLQFQSHIFNN